MLRAIANLFIFLANLVLFLPAFLIHCVHWFSAFLFNTVHLVGYVLLLPLFLVAYVSNNRQFLQLSRGGIFGLILLVFFVSLSEFSMADGTLPLMISAVCIVALIFYNKNTNKWINSVRSHPFPVFRALYVLPQWRVASFVTFNYLQPPPPAPQPEQFEPEPERHYHESDYYEEPHIQEPEYYEPEPEPEAPPEEEYASVPLPQVTVAESREKLPENLRNVLSKKKPD